jgi:hypothetical protein
MISHQQIAGLCVCLAGENRGTHNADNAAATRGHTGHAASFGAQRSAGGPREGGGSAGAGVGGAPLQGHELALLERHHGGRARP